MHIQKPRLLCITIMDECSMPSLYKTATGNKLLVIMDEFNIKPLNYDHDNRTPDFYDAPFLIYSPTPYIATKPN